MKFRGTTINLPYGVVPTSPQNGDVWTTVAGLYIRVNDATIGPLTSSTSGGGSGNFASGVVAFDGTDGQVLVGFDGNGSIEIGKQARSAPGSPYIDFHSSVGADYDVRMIAYGGDGTSGKGKLNIEADTINLIGRGHFGTVSAPTTPINGNIWFDGTNFKIHEGEVTRNISPVNTALETTGVPTLNFNNRYHAVNEGNSEDAVYFGRSYTGVKATGPSNSTNLAYGPVGYMFDLRFDNAQAGGDFVRALYGRTVFGGSAATGGRLGMLGQVDHQLGATSATNPNRNYVGTTGQAQSLNGDGGTNVVTDPKGAYFGLNGIAVLHAGATNVMEAAGCEVNTYVKAGATAKYICGATISGFNEVRGSVVDAALEIGGGTDAGFGPHVGWKHGIIFTDMHGGNPFASDSTLIGSYWSNGAPRDINHAFDLSGFNVNGAVFQTSKCSYQESAVNLAANGAGVSTIMGGNNISDAHLIFLGRGNGDIRIRSGNDGVDRFWINNNFGIGFIPKASATPTDNGMVAMEFTSNTELTFRAKGSDGTVRYSTIPLDNSTVGGGGGDPLVLATDVTTDAPATGSTPTTGVRLFSAVRANRRQPAWQSPTGRTERIQAFLGGNDVILIDVPAGTAGGYNALGGTMAADVGGVTTPAITTATPLNMQVRRVLNAVATANTMVEAKANAPWCSRRLVGGGFHFAARFGLETVIPATGRLFAGLTSATTAIPSADVRGGQANTIGLVKNSADTTLSLMLSATANQNQIVTLPNCGAVGWNIAGAMFELELFCKPGDTGFGWRVKRTLPGTTPSTSPPVVAIDEGYVTTGNMPGIDTLFVPHIWMQNVTATSSSIAIIQLYKESD